MKNTLQAMATVGLMALLGGCAEGSPATEEVVDTDATSSELLENFTFDASKGHAHLRWALIDVDKDVAKSLLPPELTLADNALTDAQHYRIGIALGEHRDVRMAAPAMSFMKWNYNELFIFMPSVRFKNLNPCKNSHSGTFAFMPTLLLDAMVPTLIGWLYGYNKKLASFERTADYSQNIVRRGQSIPVAELELDDSPVPAADDSVAVEFLSTASGSNPYGTVTFVGKSKLGLYEISDLRWDLPTIVVRSSSFHLWMRGPDFEAIGAPGLDGNDDIVGVDQGGTGFTMEYDWTLRSPVACIGL